MRKPQFFNTSWLGLAYLLTGAVLSPGVYAEGNLAQSNAHHKESCELLPSLNNHWQQGAIEGALTFNPNFRSTSLRVAVTGQQAQLSGYVDTALNRALAEQVALSVPGIRQVVNKLEVDPEQTRQAAIRTVTQDGVNYRLSNVTISNKVKSQLLANRFTSGAHIDVETHNRTVVISGAVTSEIERQLAYLVVKNTQGVKDVVNKLSIATSENVQVGVRSDL